MSSQITGPNTEAAILARIIQVGEGELSRGAAEYLLSIRFGEGDIARVKFRTTYNKLVPIRGGGSYKVLVEQMDLRCQERLYRLAEETFFDKKGTVIPMSGTSVSAEWKQVKSQGTMERLLAPACDLIKEKRQYH